MVIEAFEKSLKDGLRPVYTFVGDQPFLMDMVVEAVREKVDLGAFADMNYNLYRASEKGAVEAALETIKQLPMMSKQRLVIIREGEKIKNKQLLDRLADYLLAPNEFTCLVLCFLKLGKNTKVWKRSQKNGLAIVFDRVYERQMPFWINRMAAGQGKKMSQAAVAYLVRSVGADLTKASAEVEKAALYAGEKEIIEPDDVDAVLAAVKAESIFELTDAFGSKDRAKAFYMTKKMLDAGEKPLSILWQVGNHLKRLMLVRSLLADGAPAEEIGRVMGLMKFVRDKLISQAAKFSRKELRYSLVLLTKTDFELKNGRISNRAILEKLILDLCRQSVRQAGRSGVRQLRRSG